MVADAAKVAERIALLLKKAESTTPEEAEALTEHAERLMLRHGIDEAMVAAVGGTGQPREAIVKEKLVYSGRYGWAQVKLGADVCWGLGGLRTYRSFCSGKPTAPQTLWVVGFQGDVRRALTLIQSLQVQAQTALQAWVKGQRGTWWWECLSQQERFKQRRSFLAAFGEGAALRIERNRRVIVQESAPGTDLVLVDRAAEVDRWMDAEVGELKSARRIDLEGEAAHAGREAGLQARTGETEIDRVKELTRR